MKCAECDKLNRHQDAIEAMQEAVAYLTDAVDTDGDDQPNAAMSLQTKLRRAICDLEGVKPW